MNRAGELALFPPDWLHLCWASDEVRLRRRRFHGAFTGGFSAGYFNSVGSKEGELNHAAKAREGGRSC